MFNLLESLLPKVLMFAEGEGGGEPAAPAPAAEPASGGEPSTDIAPAGSEDVGGEKKPADWPGREDVLKSVKESRKEPEPAKPEEPKKDEAPKDGEPAKDVKPPAEPAKKEFAKSETLLTDLIEGINAEDFKGKTVKDFAEYVSQLEDSAEKNVGLQGIKDELERSGVSEEEFDSFLKSREVEQPKELKKEDFDTDEEYREAKLKAEAEAANEERLRKVEEQQQADRNKEFSVNLHKTIDDAITRHSDEVAKTCLLSNEDISSVIDLLGNVPDDVNVDVIGIMNKQLDVIANGKKAYATQAVKAAVEAAKPVHIKEYLELNTENQKKVLESAGQTPAPDFAKPEERPKGSDLEDGSLKAKVIALVKERMGKT